MENAPTKIEQITETKIIEYMESFGIAEQLSPEEKKLFIEIAIAYQLNPFKREIYCIPFGQGQYRKLSIITGYETYLKRAERTGKMNGWGAEIEGSGEDMCAKVTIYRKDYGHPFTHKAYWNECKQQVYDKDRKVWRLNSMWEKMGKFMLRKVAIAQAFRLCFPDELGGMPYTADELPDNMTTPSEIVAPEKETRRQGNFDKASAAIPTAKTLDELAKFESMIKECVWTEKEQKDLDIIIEQQAAALKAVADAAEK